VILEVEKNPKGLEDEYLRCLNICFPGWGGREAYAWAFERKCGAQPADTMLLRLDGRLLAGSAVTYRPVRVRSGRTVLAGIMTGSWTLPEARGQGCFTRIIRESVALTAARGGALLLAFVTADNKSCSRLIKAGSGLTPTSYLFSTPETPCPDSDLDIVESTAHQDAFEDFARARSRDAFVVYPSVETWKDQIFNRPNPVTLLHLGGEAWAALESGSADRLQMLVPGRLPVSQCFASLLRQSLSQGRKFVGFTTDPALREAAQSLGAGIAPGYITALIADGAALAGALAVHSPWPCADSTPLARPECPWFIGRLEFQCGDRM
jgi:hypothetical protein